MTTDNPQPQQTQSEPGGGRPVIVDVFAKLNSMGSVVFDHEWRFENDPTKSKGRIDIPKATNPNDPGTPIHFHLDDDSGRKLHFDDDPIWVKRSKCPTEACEDSEIPSASIEREDKHLKVLDINSVQCDLHYNLRFKDDKGQIEEYDPSIRNGGR